MKTSKGIHIVLFIILVLLVAVTTSIFLISKNLNSEKGDRERRYKYKISDSESYLWAYKFTPEIVIDNTKNYLKVNGFSGDDVEFFFTNKYRQSEDEDNFIFYVEQYYDRIYCCGHLEVNLKGEIVTSKDLKKAAELALVPTEPKISRGDVIQIGMDYLNLKEDTTDGVLAMIYNEPEREKWIFAYDIRFNDQSIELYVDGITGKVLKEMRGSEVIIDKKFDDEAFFINRY